MARATDAFILKGIATGEDESSAKNGAACAKPLLIAGHSISLADLLWDAPPARAHSFTIEAPISRSILPTYSLLLLARVS